MDLKDNILGGIQSTQPTVSPNQDGNLLRQNSPIQTRARAKQLHAASILWNQGTQGIPNIAESVNDREIITHIRHKSVENITQRSESPNETQYIDNIRTDKAKTTNTDRRFVHIGPTIQTPKVQQQLDDLKNQIRILTSNSQPSKTSPPPTTLSSTPTAISIVSHEPVFPTPQPKVYAEVEKLRGQSNFVV